MSRKPIVAFIGPSGVGKTSFSNRLICEYGFAQARVANTRASRVDDGEHHSFVDDETFDALENLGAFLEVDKYTSYRYGTFAESVKDILLDAAVGGVLLDLTPHGYEQAKCVYPELIAIALVPDHPGWLLERLKRRGTENQQELSERTEILDDYIKSVLRLKIPTIQVKFGPDTWDGTYAEILEIISRGV